MLNLSGWSVIGRPGYLGKHRDEKHAEWDEQYGPGNWQLAWKVRNYYVDFLGACVLYEESYWFFLFCNIGISQQLVKEASEVYDDEPSNVESGLDYLKQETGRTHIQDIAIRRTLIRFCQWFEGSTLIRIRQEKGNHPLSMILSPGRVPFRWREIIEQPEIEGWWQPGSVESFYQSNRYLQIRTN